jgi:hypothetical protein
MTTKDIFNVICVSPTYSYGDYLPLYHIGKVYMAEYLYDKILIGENEVLEFEWIVYLERHNHYQFSDEEFKKHFIEVAEERDRKISLIISNI